MPCLSSILAFVFILCSTSNSMTILEDRNCEYPSCKFVQGEQGHRCDPSSCGKIRNISYPFRLKTDNSKCGFQVFSLSCNRNVTTLYFHSKKFIVQAINYNNQTIRIVDQSAHNDESPSSLPQYSLGNFNFTRENLYELVRIEPPTNRTVKLTESVIFLSCENPIYSPLYISTRREALWCPERPYAYALFNGSLSVSHLDSSCRVELMTLVSSSISKGWNSNTTFEEIQYAIAYGIELSWERARVLKNHDEKGPRILAIGAFWVAKLLYGLPLVLLFWSCIQRRRRRFLNCDHIEQFLQRFNDRMPVRYSYSSLRKMANGFKDTLGEGGFGSVYRGKLRSSGRLVAIKMLDKLKADGQDFINEVATIGMIHHVNIVNLVGFCFEGSKRALVYDYMPMGSLDKHIFSHQANNPSINCSKMFEIALGVARGIEYLHRGCEIRILHFDIKPHNILLDENLVPKISDFGLARLCPFDHNTVSLTAARGTIGYIAPEFFYKNIGGVSHKADVYSFGMLLMEMASGRRNLDAIAERSSQIYFPSWAFHKLNEDEKSVMVESDIDRDIEEDLRTIKKMMIVALWCVQMRPIERPSMSKVIEMLEGHIETLQLPPKPPLFE